MSGKQLSRYHELQKVHEKRQTIAQAAISLGLSSGQLKGMSKRLKIQWGQERSY